MKDTTKKWNFDTELKSIGLNIAYYRRARGITQFQLAELTDMSRTHISNLECSSLPTQISIEAIFRIAQVLEVSPGALLEVRDDLAIKRTSSNT